MKKYVLSIFSLLFLITPVFADTIDLNSKHFNSFLSFESLNSSHNITYGSYILHEFGSLQPDYFYYLKSDLGTYSTIGYYSSESTKYGGTFDKSLLFPFSNSGENYTVLSTNNRYFGYMGIGFNNNRLLRNQVSIYFQASSQSNYNTYSGNYILNFGGRFSTGINYVRITDSFVRFLYDYSTDTETWFKNSDYPLLQFPTSASDIQLFTKGENRFYTSKGLASVDDIYYSHLVSSVGNGFSFVNDITGSVSYDDFDFYTVLPYWDSSWSSDSSSFSVPSSSYIKGVYIFKNNSLGRNSDFQDIGVISKCNMSLCSGLYNNFTGYLNSLVVSNYICDFSQNFGLRDNCLLVGGGILYNVFNGLFTGLNSVVSVSSLPNIFKPIYSFFRAGSSLGVNYNFISSPYKLKLSYITKPSNLSTQVQGVYSDSYTISYTGGYTISNSPDILSTINFSDNIPGNSNNDSIYTGELSENTIKKCLWDINYYNMNTIICNSLGVFIGEDGDPVLNTSSSGASCLKLVKLYNEDGDLVEKVVTCDEAQSYLSGGFYSDSSGNVYFRCFGDSCLYTSVSQYFQSGLVSSSYYNSDSLFFSCPYPILTGSNDLLTTFSSIELGQFSIGLPIVCFYSSFQAGKNFSLFSGLTSYINNPLMGLISSSEDDRNYLYKFFDIILCIGILMFLLKLYHLTK